MKAVDPTRFARLEQLYDACTDLDASLRRDYLDRYCADDPDLAAEVLAIFADDIPGRRFIHATAETGRAILQLPTERMIGPYHVLSELGHGGMGSVWLAERADGAFTRQVAIKLLRGFPSRDALSRLRREREILARLDHRHIARLLDGGESAQGQPYLVLEYVQGERIDRYADDARLNIDQRISLFLSVCDAIASAHRQLIVHRDIKPANVLVNAQGAVKVLDFGVARLLEQAHSETDTESQWIYATRNYASPEQLRGLPVTTASDIYSLGVLLAELLAGNAPGEERKGKPPSRWSTVDSVAQRRGLDARKLRAQLHGDLDAILCCAMAEETSERYRDVQALIDDLQRHRKHQPVQVRRAGALYVSGKFLRRHGWRLLISVVVTSALLAVGARYLIVQRRAALEAHIVRGVSAVLRDVYSGREGSRRGDMPARQFVAEGAGLLAAAADIQPLVRSRLQFLFGLSMANLGELETAHRMLDQAIQIRESTLGRSDTESARIRAAHLQLRLDLEDGEHARAEWKKIQSLDSSLYPLDREDEIERTGLEGQIALLQGEHERARQLLMRTHQDAIGYYGANSRRTGPPAMRLARAALLAGDVDTATEYAQRAVAVYAAEPDRSAPQRRLALALLQQVEEARKRLPAK